MNAPTIDLDLLHVSILHIYASAGEASVPWGADELAVWGGEKEAGPTRAPAREARAADRD